MPIEDSPIPTKAANHSYPVIAARAGSGCVQCQMSLGWGITMLKNIALLNIVCPQRNKEPLQDKAARVVRTLTEMWLTTTTGGLVAHIHHPGLTADWCVGDIIRRESGDSLAQLMWHNDMAALYPMQKDEVWSEDRLHCIINGGCKLLNVQPGDLEADPEVIK